MSLLSKVPGVPFGLFCGSAILLSAASLPTYPWRVFQELVALLGVLEILIVELPLLPSFAFLTIFWASFAFCDGSKVVS